MEDFTIRLLEILENKSLSASQFAEKIGVQRSSVSHVLSGRNKPSLDFIVKMSAAFTDISLNWLINGKKSEKTILSKNIPFSNLSNEKNIINIQLQTPRTGTYNLSCGPEGIFILDDSNNLIQSELKNLSYDT